MRQNLSLKWCQPLKFLKYFEKGSRSFHTGNIGSVDQRAAKLLAVRFGSVKEKSVASAITAEVFASAFGLGSSPPRIESFSKFDGQYLLSPLMYRPYITCMERSKPLLNIC